MLLKGVEYAHSPQKQKLDLLLARGATPLALGARLAVKGFLASDHPELNVFYEEKRAGANDEEFVIKKFQTLDPNTLESLGPWADFLRQHGIDELAQVDNIKEGNMSFVARRPLWAEELEELFDKGSPRLVQRYRTLVLPTKGGLVSSYAMYAHTQYSEDANQYDKRLECDIKDVIDGSVVYDLRLVASLAAAAAVGRMKFGRIELGGGENNGA